MMLRTQAPTKPLGENLTADRTASVVNEIGCYQGVEGES